MDRAVALKRTHLGYTYKLDKIKNFTTYMECSQTKVPCKGRINIKRNGAIVITMRHTHPPDPLLDAKKAMKTDIKHAISVSDINVPLKKVYDKYRQIHPQAGRAIPYMSLSSSMQDWRKKVVPPTPVSLADMFNIMQEEKWQSKLHYNLGKMVARLIIAADQAVSLLLFNPLFAIQFVNTKELLVDATFQVVPRRINATQLFVIMAEKFNHLFPIAWALMERKSTEAYVSVLREFADSIPRLQPDVTIADYEVAIRTALLAVYKNASFQGCNTHFKRAINKKFQDSKFVNQSLFKKNFEMKKIRDKMTSLSYLPVEDVGCGFERIKNDASPEARQELAQIFEYFQSQWMDKTTPAHFSVHHALRRTTNYVESHNSLLFFNMKSHPSAWEFVDKLKDILASVHADLDSVRLGRKVFRAPRRETLVREELLQDLWDNYENGMPIEQFLEDAANLNRLVSNTVRYGGR